MMSGTMRVELDCGCVIEGTENDLSAEWCSRHTMDFDYAEKALRAALRAR